MAQPARERSQTISWCTFATVAGNAARMGENFEAVLPSDGDQRHSCIIAGAHRERGWR